MVYVVYMKCSTNFRNVKYKVQPNQYGVDPSSCKKCICENGQFNRSTCIDGHNCSMLTSTSRSNCQKDGKWYQHQKVFAVDKCNKCKCFGGKVSGCTRRKCKGAGNGDSPCDKCRKSHRHPVCGPNDVTYYNLCAAEHCAGFDRLEVTPGPCSVQVNLCY